MEVKARIDENRRDRDGHLFALRVIVNLPDGSRETWHASLDPGYRTRASELALARPAPNELRRIREEQGLSQADLARKAGVSAAQLSRWEDGSKQPLLHSAVSLARALEVPIAELRLTIYGVDPPAPRLAVGA